MSKSQLRQRFLVQRKRLDEQQYIAQSFSVQRLLLASDLFAGAVSLALYSPVQKEVATDYIFERSRAAGKKVCYPRVVGDGMHFYPVDTLDMMNCGAFGVCEPAITNPVVLDDLDLVIVPGVAFDMRGYRLGYGKGYYDRKLAGCQKRPLLVGLCFEFQICQDLPIEEHDQSLDLLVTESRIIPCHNGVAGLV